MMDGKASGATAAQALLGIAFSGPALNGKGQHTNVGVAIINAMLERLMGLRKNSSKSFLDHQ